MPRAGQFEDHSMTARLFVYGSLADPGSFARLTGRRYRVVSTVDQRPSGGLFAIPAVLPDHRDGAPMRRYPIALPQLGDQLEGLLIFRVTDGVLHRLDRYEGQGYLRRPVTVSTAQGEYRAFCYIGGQSDR